jgi:hypothetical protein
MNTPPPLLLAASLLFWGWQSHLLSFALPMALLLEGARFSSRRWLLNDKDFNRVADVSALLWVLVAVYLFNQYAVHGLFLLLNWLPFLFFLLMLVQNYSSVGSIRLSSLFMSLRGKEGGEGFPEIQRVNLSYPYILICILASSAMPAPGFFWGAYVLGAWGLWAVRPRRYRIGYWLSLWVLVAGMAYWGQLGLQQLQQAIDTAVVSWLDEYFSHSRDPYRQITALGEIGKLKQSDKILLRVRTQYPVLLREASYNTYYNMTWRSALSNFENVSALSDARSWEFLNPLPKESTSVEISAYLPEGKGILALPTGTHKISHLSVGHLQHNTLGAVKVEQGLGLVTYRADFGVATPLDSPPNAQDLSIPPNERDALKQIVTQLQLENMPAFNAIRRIDEFFSQQFQYSLILNPPANGSPLANFLLKQHSGHCEFFATATVLLLRQLGIPARYAVGFAAEEYSFLENAYIVRRRHAHAWTQFYLNGRWQELDTTPAGWEDVEAEQTASWRGVNDLWAWLTHQFSLWKWSEEEDNHQGLIWLVIPLVVILLWRLYFKERVQHAKSATLVLTRPRCFGEDSAFYAVLQVLETRYYARPSGETLAHWLARLPLTEALQPSLQQIMSLHQRYRFDPQGLNEAQQQQLKALVATVLQELKREQIKI